MEKLIADIETIKTDLQQVFANIQSALSAAEGQNAALASRVQHLEEHLQRGGGPGFEVKL
jgi:ribosomal protein S15P/S13E